MQLTNEQMLPVSQQQAWLALNDPQALQACIPGCESLLMTAPDEFEMTLSLAVGPVKARFKGKLRLADLNAPESYTLHFEGQGAAAGHGKGSAQVRLEPRGTNETVLLYTASATVGGKIAQVGARLVDMTASKMATRFFAAFTEHLKSQTS